MKETVAERLRSSLQFVLHRKNNPTEAEEHLREIITSDMKMKEALRYIALIVLETRVEVRWMKRILFLLLSLILGLEGLNFLW